jgi:hypothetical protein
VGPEQLAGALLAGFPVRMVLPEPGDLPMFVIKNVREHAVKVDGVDIAPDEQLDFQTISPDPAIDGD